MKLASPKKEKETPEEESNEMTKSDEADVDTAVGLLVPMMLSPEGEGVIVKTLSSSNPVKGLAMYFTQAMDMIQTKSMGTDIPLNPLVWLADGGVIDEVMVDVAEIADRNGVPFSIGQVLPPLKQEIDKMIIQLAQAQEQGGQPQQQQQAPPPQQGGLAAPQPMGA